MSAVKGHSTVRGVVVVIVGVAMQYVFGLAGCPAGGYAGYSARVLLAISRAHRRQGMALAVACRPADTLHCHADSRSQSGTGADRLLRALLTQSRDGKGAHLSGAVAETAAHSDGGRRLQLALRANICFVPVNCTRNSNVVIFFNSCSLFQTGTVAEF